MLFVKYLRSSPCCFNSSPGDITDNDGRNNCTLPPKLKLFKKTFSGQLEFADFTVAGLSRLENDCDDAGVKPFSTDNRDTNAFKVFS